MKFFWNIRTILLFPPLLVAIFATVISFATLYYLKIQFDQAHQLQAEYMDLILEAEKLSEQTLAIHLQARSAMHKAVDGEIDELHLYYIHSDVVNALAGLQQRLHQFSSNHEVQKNNLEDISHFNHEFDNYRRFMIMATDIIAIDPRTANQYISTAHDHFVVFTHISHRIRSRLLEHVNEMQARDIHLLELTYQRTLLYGLLAMLLVYLAVRLISRQLSHCLMLIANSLKTLGKPNQAPPELPEIVRLQGRAHGEIKFIADAVVHFRNAMLERHQQEARIQQLSYFDPLTGLANRRLLLEHLSYALQDISRHPQHCALLFIDLDNFKNINDTIGHSAGDELLQQAAERIVHHLRSADTAARPGGDEFIILLVNLSHDPNEAATQVKQTAEHLLHALQQPFSLGEIEHHLSASIGVTLTNSETEQGDQMMLNADLALYQAKAAGKNVLRFFDPQMQETITRRTQMEADLRQAISNQQLILYYQPQIDRHGKLLGYEALIRWQHPVHGLISPLEFIPLAEETGLIVEIGNWVLHTACQLLTRWDSDVKKSFLSISVNVSSVQFAREDFAQQVSTAVVNNGANPARLKLELTESLLLKNVDDTIIKMQTINRMGVRFSLDDFGTGYSSLSYLKHLPLSWLKIDKSFVRDMLDDRDDEAIVRTIIALAKSLGLTVVAEGVETETHHQHLLSLGCDEFQGYYFGRPAPLE